MKRMQALRRHSGDRELPREEQIARSLCEKLNDSGCTCRKYSAPGTCSRMVFVAKHAIKLVRGEAE